MIRQPPRSTGTYPLCPYATRFQSLDRTPPRPAMRKPVVRSAEGQRPRLGRAIIFEDHRPPPVDHPDLHVERAGRAGVEDILQRAQIIFPPDRVGKRKTTYEHRDRKRTRLNSSN